MVVAVDNTVFNQRHKQRTSLLKNLDIGIEFLQTGFVAVAVDRRGSSDNADFAVFGLAHGCVGGGVYNSGVGHGKLSLEPCSGYRADGSARGYDHLYVVLKQKMSVLKSVFVNGVAASGAVGHSAGIAEIYDAFVREDVHKLLDGAQSAESRVKNADSVAR